MLTLRQQVIEYSIAHGIDIINVMKNRQTASSTLLGVFYHAGDRWLLVRPMVHSSKVFPGNDLSCCRPAAAPSLASALCGLKPSGHLFGLCEVLIARSPEEQAAGDPSNRHRNPDLAGYTQDAVLHGRWADAVSNRHTGGLIGQRQNLGSKRVIEYRVHARTASHPPCLFQWDIFKLNTWRGVGHNHCSFDSEDEVRTVRHVDWVRMHHRW